MTGENYGAGDVESASSTPEQFFRVPRLRDFLIALTGQGRGIRSRAPHHPALSPSLIASIQRGSLDYKYRGISTLKCPFDLAIYSRLIWDLRPGSIIEFGSHRGGSALWLADTVRAFGLPTQIYSFDLNSVTAFSDPQITFGWIDVGNPATYPQASLLEALPRPLLFIDDASHIYEHVLAALEFIHRHLRAGDYLIIEDGSLTYMAGFEAKYNGGPLRAMREFLDRHPRNYDIDRDRCDTFGPNVTWNVDGYIKRIR